MTNNIEWEPFDCSHTGRCDITEELKEMLTTRFNVENFRADNTYFLEFWPDGQFYLSEYNDSGGGPILNLPHLQHCPLCGKYLSKG